ncbi:MAG: DUF4125 family protein, partial [Acholeplasmatales bacterium]|nr:DUF4125 family protein [Acholeplasmatales bacterium]
IDELYRYGIILNKKSSYIEDYKKEISNCIQSHEYKMILINRIVDLEWRQFTVLNNIGKRALCQDNYDYFKLMRESQFYLYSIELLKSYQNDLVEAENNNYNLLELKYAYMMESTDIDEFNKIKDRLPVISQKRKELMEMIIEVQVEQMEQFSKYNKDKTNLMRTIKTSTDTKNNTSYETYLRGELSSLSEKTMYLYGKLIKEYALNKKNFPEGVVNISLLLNR